MSIGIAILHKLIYIYYGMEIRNFSIYSIFFFFRFWPDYLIYCAVGWVNESVIVATFCRLFVVVVVVVKTIYGAHV